MAALKADPNVAAVAPDLPVHATAQTLPTGIDRIDGELSSTQSRNGSSVQAGVTYAVAAGNCAADANTFVPATYSQVITVSALADFSGQPGGGAAPTCRAAEDDTFADSPTSARTSTSSPPGVCILCGGPRGAVGPGAYARPDHPARETA